MSVYRYSEELDQKSINEYLLLYCVSERTFNRVTKYRTEFRSDHVVSYDRASIIMRVSRDGGEMEIAVNLTFSSWTIFNYFVAIKKKLCTYKLDVFSNHLLWVLLFCRHDIIFKTLKNLNFLRLFLANVW